MFKILFITIFIAFFSNTVASKLGCLDENNELVDWFYLYKLPLDKEHVGGESKSDGYKYVYITSKSVDESWQVSDLKVSDSESIPGRTISQLYGEDDEV